MDTERTTERGMLDRLAVKYGGRTRNGKWSGAKFLRAEHVPLGLSLRRDRICDFVATGMHSTPWTTERNASGEMTYVGRYAPVFHGHEVKVSRSDWLTELRDPGKAAAFRKHMNFWWLVAPREVVRGDLPEGWGHMVPNGRSLRIVTQATLNPEPEPMPSGLIGALMRATVVTEEALLRAALTPPGSDGSDPLHPFFSADTGTLTEAESVIHDQYQETDRNHDYYDPTPPGWGSTEQVERFVDVMGVRRG